MSTTQPKRKRKDDDGAETEIEVIDTSDIPKPKLSSEQKQWLIDEHGENFLDAKNNRGNVKGKNGKAYSNNTALPAFLDRYHKDLEREPALAVYGNVSFSFPLVASYVLLTDFLCYSTYVFN